MANNTGSNVSGVEGNTQHPTPPFPQEDGYKNRTAVGPRGLRRVRAIVRGQKLYFCRACGSSIKKGERHVCEQQAGGVFWRYHIEHAPERA